ncbi:MAG: DinB family protein [Anaerolineae bacterium]
MLDTILSIIKELNDAQLVFLPHDPNAHDPYAVVGEEHIGWSLAHLVAHVTASSEEGAAHSSALARGIPLPTEPRLRYETPWKAITTRAEVLQRIEESRRIRLAFLDTWPDNPHLDVYRETSARFLERFGKMNAKMAFLFGLKHELGHHAQIREVARQAQELAQA